MWLHHVTGSPTGTGSRTFSATSWSRPAFTLSCQWSGTGTGVLWATGSAVESTISLTAAPFIDGSGWCSLDL